MRRWQVPWRPEPEKGHDRLRTCAGREKYLSGKDVDKVALARQLAGIWKDRKDLKAIGPAVRRLRKGIRLKKTGRP